MADAFFYCPDLASDSGHVVLSGEEARHAAGARRLRVGDELSLFDGRGTVARAAITEIAERSRTLTLRVEERSQMPRLRTAVHLACALPKGDRQSVLLDTCTQLGMRSFTPLECERSVVKPSEGARTRWERICLEACKQSRQAYLPAIHAAAAPGEIAAATQGQLWIAHPGGKSPGALLSQAGSEAITIMIGPEGGFTDAEVAQALDRGAVPVGLGPAILRIEAAAVALLAAVRLCGLGKESGI